ncbi:hypothetical protein BJ508DRAFT_314549 [Ascobolus immersus RN42]|uniref:Uncharacterized protein n=1 Tax=Ascobolus immersus RN42 TaxID=1160509 RepID=A0A3N4HLD2_ASCIM|nr:hypothetical protein BJ508DRAFT_314549 [Ascobolus immersus RN42]
MALPTSPFQNLPYELRLAIFEWIQNREDAKSFRAMDSVNYCLITPTIFLRHHLSDEEEHIFHMLISNWAGESGGPKDGSGFVLSKARWSDFEIYNLFQGALVPGTIVKKRGLICAYKQLAKERLSSWDHIQLRRGIEPYHRLQALLHDAEFPFVGYGYDTTTDTINAPGKGVVPPILQTNCREKVKEVVDQLDAFILNKRGPSTKDYRGSKLFGCFLTAALGRFRTLMGQRIMRDGTPHPSTNFRVHDWFTYGRNLVLGLVDLMELSERIYDLVRLERREALEATTSVQ